MTDIIIIGAGPAGLTAAIYARRAAKSVLVLEAKGYGGQIINTPEIENYPGIKNISGLEIISKNNEIENINYLIFKVDIKRDDTISTQVVYQLYEPEKNKINEKIYLDENNTTVLLSLPIAWREGQLEKIKELSNKNIDAFDSSSPFYIDVCNKFTNSKHDDVFLEDRKKDYYPNEAFCEKGCQFDKFDKITEKIICKCKFKNNMDTFKNVTFDYNKKDVKFEKVK